MSTFHLTNEQARRFILLHQYLLPPRTINGKEELLGFFNRVGCIQYDPLNIAGTNPDLVLQARVRDFKPELLKEMLYTDRTLLDNWDKMMAIYPVADHPFFHYRQIEASMNSHRRNNEAVLNVMPEIRKEIEERGPLSSIDLDHDTKVTWAWGPMRLAKAALDEMYYRGELIIHHKINTRKYYDLASRHLPQEVVNAPDPHPSIEEYHDWHVHRRLRGVGMLWNRAGAWLGIHNAGAREVRAALKRLYRRGEIEEVSVEGIDVPFFVSTLDIDTLHETQKDEEMNPQAVAIAPLDNILWDREMVSALYNFSYRWEVYKPVKDREYGYYVLPVLYGDRFIARFEPVRDRKTNTFGIKNWWWEKDVRVTDEMRNALNECFTAFKGYLDVKKIKVRKTLMTREGLDWLP